jgi:hypothetical protein
MADASHGRKLWFGRKELFFCCSFRMLVAAYSTLLSVLYDFKCPDAQKIQEKEGGARKFCVPDTPWLIVLPINHILSRVPLMKAYLCGSPLPTIPRALSHLKQTHFRHGHADRNGRKGTCSPLLMLDVHMWQFGRPQPKTISVQQRRANKEIAKKAANLKRAQHKPYTQEKAERRRAMRAASQCGLC